MAFGMKDVLNGAKAVAGATSGNILQGGLGNYSEIPVEQLQQEYGMYLMNGEVIRTGFKLIRDALIFTDKRIIFTDKQGATGTKMRVESINLFSVVDVTMETAGFGFDDSDILAQELFGPTVGKELRNNAIKAVLLAAVGMLIYIRLRFKEWNFGASAILGVLHDVLIVLTFYAVFNVTVNNPFIAGILTVVGYSINDTIVIFDRIRENNQLMRKDEEEIIDISINQTLSRSIMTTFTTLIVMVPMFIMTSASMREFILPLMVGVAAGCLSSIFICSPLYYQFSQHKRKTRYQKTLEEGKKKKKKKYIGGTGNKE